MKKTIISFILLAIMLFSTTAPVFAEDYIDDIPKDSHKILNKWDMAGSFTSARDVSTIGRTWTFDIHVKQAMYGPYSQGILSFVSGDDVITAHVEDVKQNYNYWTRTGIEYIVENLATVGWAEFNGEIFYFMSLYSEGGMWIILSKTPYDSRWAAGDVYQGLERAYELLSYPWPPTMSEYDFDPKEIH